MREIDGILENDMRYKESVVPKELSYSSMEALENSSDVDLYENVESVQMSCMEPEVRMDVPNCEVALVTGNPFDAAPRMNYNQGHNPYNARGNCGLVSISNTLQRGGFCVGENEVTKLAIERGLCYYDPGSDGIKNGGTTAEQRKKLLETLGFSSDIKYPQDGGNLEDIADAIDSGKGVLIAGNAGILWDYDDGSTMINGKLVSNHCVTVTGVARDASTGKIAGIYIADSGQGLKEDQCRYLTVEEFDDFYTDVHGSSAVITREPIMEV